MSECRSEKCKQFIQEWREKKVWRKKDAYKKWVRRVMKACVDGEIPEEDAATLLYGIELTIDVFVYLLKLIGEAKRLAQRNMQTGMRREQCM